MDDALEDKKTVKVRKSRPAYGNPGQEVEVTGILKTRLKSNGARRMKLNRSERREMNFSLQIEKAVAMFLDLEHEYTLTQMAEELSISVNAFKDLTKLPEFMDKYNEHFMDLGHDPRLRASQAALTDMLPAAVKQLKILITDCETPASTRLSAIKELFSMVGVEAPKSQSERAELADFLKDHSLTLNQININPPQKPDNLSEQPSSALEGVVLSTPAPSAPSPEDEPSEQEGQ